MDTVFAWPIGGRITRGLTVLALCLVAFACNDLGEEPIVPFPVLNFTVRNTDTLEYPTVGGDEEGARIIVQAQHYRISEIRRYGSSTLAIYVYQPELGYVGRDYTELEIYTNPTGRREDERVSKVGLSFTVTH